MTSIIKPLFASLAVTVVLAGPAVMAGPMQQATFTATVDGNPWKADFALATTSTIGTKAVLVISGTSNSGGTISTFNASLPVPASGDYVGTFAIRKGIMGDVPIANFNMPQRSTDILEQGFTMAEGEIVIESFDAAGKTISGHFSAKGQTRAKTASMQITDGVFAKVPINPDPTAQ
ncbi:MAG: hypothetical protein J0I79_21735 [Mesorhizobium sp.]|uniref:DUF6252 family protein n=1 Tax=Mesorhizobium sp. TaxID=1871066 RepID=UPI001AC82BCB|nr:DUF6252 family protein [Mesorhizobium sp.]MBN9220578.1 hypothetical protein [Mesorhizobium sp.]